MLVDIFRESCQQIGMLALIRKIWMEHILNDLSQPVPVSLVSVKGCLYLFNDGGNLFGNALLRILVHNAVPAIPERIAVPILIDHL